MHIASLYIFVTDTYILAVINLTVILFYSINILFVLFLDIKYVRKDT